MIPNYGLQWNHTGLSSDLHTTPLQQHQIGFWLNPLLEYQWSVKISGRITGGLRRPICKPMSKFCGILSDYRWDQEIDWCIGQHTCSCGRALCITSIPWDWTYLTRSPDFRNKSAFQALKISVKGREIASVHVLEKTDDKSLGLGTRFVFWVLSCI